MNISKNGAIKKFWSVQKILKTTDSHLIVQGVYMCKLTHKGSVLHMSIKLTRQFHNMEKTKISYGNVPVRKQMAQQPISENNMNLIFVDIPF